MKKLFRHLAVTAAVGAALATAPAALATDRYVDGSPGFGHDSNNVPCTDPAKPCLTIGFAVNESGPGDTVHVGGGNTYAESVELPDGVSLVESDFDGAGFLTNGDAIVDGGVGPAVSVLPGAARTVAGLTLRGGDVPGFSASLTVGADAVLAGNRFDDARDGVDTHVWIEEGSPYISENKFVGENDGKLRVGILNDGPGAPEIVANTFLAFNIGVQLTPLGATGVAHVRGNEITGIYTAAGGQHGGGVYADDANAVIEENLIEADAAATFAEGVSIADAGNVSLRRNRILGFPVAGVFVTTPGSPVSLSGDVIAQNNMGIVAGGGSGLTVENATITGSDPSSGEIVLEGTHLTLDSSSVGSSGIRSISSSCAISHSNLEPGGSPAASATCGPAAFASSVAPGYVEPLAKNYHLLPSSLLIDRGNPAAPAAGSVDPDGDARTLDGDQDCVARRDIGADEYKPSTADCTMPTRNPSPAPTPSSSAAAPSTPGGATSDIVRPVISGLTATNRLFRIGRRVIASSARVARGTAFRFRLSEGARATFLIERRTIGRRVAGGCVRATRRNRASSACVRYIPVLRLRRDAAAGANSVRFTGRVRLGRRVRTLHPGRYRLTLSARDAATNRSRSARLTFRVTSG
jgi:hypothetical protein